MAKKLFVGGLSYETTHETLKEAFSQAGTVESANVIVDKISGRSKGFGFVEMSSDEEAQKAIVKFKSPDNDSTSKTFDGRRLIDSDGGWELLNFKSIRNEISAHERKEYQKQWDRNNRKYYNSDKSDKIRQNPTNPTQAEAEAEAEAEVKSKSKTPPTPKAVDNS